MMTTKQSRIWIFRIFTLLLGHSSAQWHCRGQDRSLRPFIISELKAPPGLILDYEAPTISYIVKEENIRQKQSKPVLEPRQATCGLYFGMYQMQHRRVFFVYLLYSQQSYNTISRKG
jgi:hypothetical protein